MTSGFFFADLGIRFLRSNAETNPEVYAKICRARSCPPWAGTLRLTFYPSRRPHPREVSFDPPSRQAARADRRPSDDRARLSTRRAGADASTPCSSPPTTSALPKRSIAFGGIAVMTARRSRDRHRSARGSRAPIFDGELIVNVQGDEPLISPDAIDAAVGLMFDRPDGRHRRRSAAALTTPPTSRTRHVVKVVVDHRRLRPVFHARRDPVHPRRAILDPRSGGTSGSTSIAGISC